MDQIWKPILISFRYLFSTCETTQICKNVVVLIIYLKNIWQFKQQSLQIFANFVAKFLHILVLKF